MTRRVTASEAGLKPHYKVRLVFQGSLIHVASWDEPERDVPSARRFVADWIDDPEYGDSIGFIDWSKVSAVTWRYSE